MNGKVDEYVEKKQDISLPVLERHVSLMYAYLRILFYVRTCCTY